jgi:hypothetical protein
VRTHRHPERIPIAPSTQRPAVILPRLQQGIEDCAKTCTVKSKSRSANSRPEAYQLANDRSWRKAAIRNFGEQLLELTQRMNNEFASTIATVSLTAVRRRDKNRQYDAVLKSILILHQRRQGDVRILRQNGKPLHTFPDHALV